MDKPTWHRSGSTSVRQAHKGDKSTRRETWVGDTGGIVCGAPGCERSGRRMVAGEEVKKKRKQKNE